MFPKGMMPKWSGTATFKRVKCYFWPDGRLKYIGYNDDIDAAETDTKPGWEIYKFNYTEAGDIDPNIEGPRYGAVNHESVINALSWNI